MGSLGQRLKGAVVLQRLIQSALARFERRTPSKRRLLHGHFKERYTLDFVSMIATLLPIAPCSRSSL